jgi:NitT/TauT family transport system ATP-binding protein
MEAAVARLGAAALDPTDGMATRRSIVSVNEVTKRFKVRAQPGQPGVMVALDRVSMEIREGELVSLLGASGCGKTTLLRILAGLVPLDEGTVTVQGTPVKAPRRDLCMVFQNFGLLPWRSIMANVSFPLELDGMGRAEREEVAARYIGLVGLKGFERHYPHELSGGMQQRVGIARALTRKPSVLLMDEPFAALDAQTRETLQEDFLRIWKELRTTVIFVTHSIDEALVMSDRVMIFTPRPGRLKRIIETPLALGIDRTETDVRALPEFARHRQEIRQMLRETPR